MDWFWYWNTEQREWVKAWEYLIQMPDLPSKRKVFRSRGYCTAAEKRAA